MEKIKSYSNDVSYEETMMNSITLPRITLNMPELESFNKVAINASSSLGYQTYKDKMADMQLLGVMAELGILPFEQAAVDEYKRKKLREKNGSPLLSWLKFHPWYWESQKISSYDGYIPQDILEKAIQLSYRYSRNDDSTLITIGVETLEKRRHVVDPDPFIYVRVWTGQDERTPRHYFAVWDEPGFQF
jgi:hypothetical protein